MKSQIINRISLLVCCITIMFSVATSLSAADKKKVDKKTAKTDKKKVVKITYDDHVKPIFRDKCFSCHNSDKKKGGLDLSTYGAMLEGGGSGESVEKGSADDSYLFMLVNHDSEPAMPPKADKLATASIELMRKWIDQGALENSGSKIIASKPKTTFKLKDASNSRPTGPPPMPNRMSLEPLVTSKNNTAITAIATSPWAPLVAIAGQKQVLLYNTKTLDPVAVFPFPEGVPYVLKFSRNGSLLLAGGGRGAKVGKVAIWEVKTGKRLFTVGDELDCVIAADISSDQSMIALAGPTRIIRVYSTEDGSLMYQIKKHTDWVTTLEFSPDSVLLATGDRSNGLFVWEAQSGQEYLNLKGHRGTITDVSWRSDSNILASSSEDGNIKTWEMNNGSQVKTWRAHSTGVADIEFSRDGKIASCGRDKRASLWDQNGKRLRAFPLFTDLALRVSYCDETKSIIAGDWTGKINVWDSIKGANRGELSANPPALKVRLENLKQSVATFKSDYKQKQLLQQKSTTALNNVKAALNASNQLVSTSRATQSQQNNVISAAKKTMSDSQSKIRSVLKQKAQKMSRLNQFKKQQSTAEKGLAKAPEKNKKSALAKLTGVKNEITKLTALVQNDDKTVKDLNQKITSAKQQMNDANKKILAAKASEKKAVTEAARLTKAIKPYFSNVSKAKTATAITLKQLTSTQASIKKWEAEITFASKQ